MKILAGYGTTLGTVSKTATESLQELQTGLAALQTGTVQLQEGSSQLEAGMAAFGEGIRQLYQGSAALHQGSGQLSSTGTALIDGLDTMISGMDSLHQGLVKFDEDGIQELSDLTGTDLNKPGKPDPCTEESRWQIRQLWWYLRGSKRKCPFYYRDG